MRIIQNGYNQKRNAYDQTEFFICTHNYHPLHRILGMGGSSSSGYPGKYIIQFPPPLPAVEQGGLYLFHDCQIWDETYRIIYKILNDIGAHTLFSFHSKNKVSPENYALLFYSENTYLCVLSDCAIFPYLFLRL